MVMICVLAFPAFGEGVGSLGDGGAAAGPGADKWGGGALRFGSGALATRAGRERALKDVGRLQLVFGGQCPLGLHALLPFDKTYVAVVLRVALWQIGPSADASRNNLLVDASARPRPCRGRCRGAGGQRGGR